MGSLYKKHVGACDSLEGGAMSFWGWLTGTDKYAAVQCALIAKYTFSQITEVDKKSVESSARWVLEVGGTQEMRLRMQWPD